MRSHDSIPESAAIAPDGTFRFEGLGAQKYLVRLSWPGAWVQSIRLGTTGTAGDVLDLTNGPGDGGLAIRIAPATGTLSGTVFDKEGKPWEARVVLLSGDGMSAFQATSVSAKGGAYQFTGLPPGTYKAVAIPEDDADRFAEPTGLIDYEDRMTTVNLGDGESRELNLLP